MQSSSQDNLACDMQQQQQQQHHHHHHHHQRQTTPVFGNVSQPLTFDAIARSSSTHLVTSTLQQYGPAGIDPLPDHHQHSYNHMGHVSNHMMPNTVHTLQQPQQQPHITQHQHPHQQQIQQQQQPRSQEPVTRQASEHTTSNSPPIYPHVTVPAHCRPTPVSGVPIYNISTIVNTKPIQPSPPKPTSPPLDTIKKDIPQPRKKTLAEMAKDDCEKLTLTELIDWFNEIDKHHSTHVQSRNSLEKKINDVVRRYPGQNVEHNPEFMNLKLEQKELQMKIMVSKDALQILIDKADKKFGHKLQQNTNKLSQPLAQQKPREEPKRTPRARMSTAAPTPNISEDHRVYLDLKDGCQWCSCCDYHCKDLDEYCDHLHKREHQMNKTKISQPPWRVSNHYRQLDKPETVSRYKSMCDKIKNSKDGDDLSITSLDKVLNPNIKDKETFKKMALSRERKQFDDQDRLFQIKGIDYIVPITGFWCNLCNRTMCDKKDLENHLKGWSHNFEFVKLVALQPAHELERRAKLEKSLKAMQDSSERPRPSTSSSSKSHSSSSKPSVNLTGISSHSSTSHREPSVEPSTAGLISHWSARQPYKKPTSKIVDQHEVIADKFDKRVRDTSIKTPEPIKQVSPSKASPSPDRKRSLPEIVPVSENASSAALKRLKANENQRNEKKNKTVIVTRIDSSIDEDSDEPPLSVKETSASKKASKPSGAKPRVIIEDGGDDNDNGAPHLARGDPDSPFPDLELRVTGNLPVCALKDLRLARGARVVMNRINIDDYRHMLLSEEGLWSRIDYLMTKKENDDSYQKELESATVTAPCLFDPSGAIRPVEIDKDQSSEEDESGKKPFEIGMLEDFFRS